MEIRATVIIPTFGNAKFACWAIKSVQYQTVYDIEICIICDGSPEQMVSFFKNMAKEDSRIKVFTFQKSPRTGEPYRDIVIKQTTGKNIYYCCHDDLWLPHHIQELERSLNTHSLTHSLHTIIKLPEKIKDENELFRWVYFDESELFRWINSIDFRENEIFRTMLWGDNYLGIGLTFGAHTRKIYCQLEEGWVTTPRKYIPTDIYMWHKLLSSNRKECKAIMKVTALNFWQKPRKDWSEQERYEELKHYYEIICDSDFLKKIDNSSFEIHVSSFQLKTKKGIHKLSVIIICLLSAYRAYKRNNFAVFLRKIGQTMSLLRQGIMLRCFFNVRANRTRKSVGNKL